MILLDTHVLIWSQFDPKQLGKKTRALIERKWPAGDVAVCAITFWEVGQLHERKRIALDAPLGAWRGALLAAGLVEYPLSGNIAVGSLNLGALHGDPADRFIAATALNHNATLVTADEKLLAWRHALDRHDART